METIECWQCKSVMGLVKKTPRWALYKCYSCRQVSGQIKGDLAPDEFEDAESEMDLYAGSLVDAELADWAGRLQKMSPEELDNFFKRKKD